MGWSVARCADEGKVDGTSRHTRRNLLLRAIGHADPSREAKGLRTHYTLYCNMLAESLPYNDTAPLKKYLTISHFFLILL